MPNIILVRAALGPQNNARLKPVRGAKTVADPYIVVEPFSQWEKGCRQVGYIVVEAEESGNTAFEQRRTSDSVVATVPALPLGELDGCLGRWA